jgi:hypothetical protein
MSNKSIFTRGDDGVGDRAKQWTDAKGDKAKIKEFLTQAALKPNELAYLKSEAVVSKEDVPRVIANGTMHPGIVFAKYRRWEIADWQDYAIEIASDATVGPEMVEFEAAVHRIAKKEKRARKTGLTAEAGEHLNSWREAEKTMKEGEIAMRNLGLVLKAEAFSRAEQMAAKRVASGNPWREYLEREQADWTVEGKEIDNLKAFRGLMKTGHTKESAVAQLMPQWTAHRQTQLAKIAQKITSGGYMVNPPPALDLGLSAADMARLKAQKPAAPDRLLTPLLQVPGDNFYRPRRPTRSGRQTTVVLTADEEELLDDDDDEYEEENEMQE